MKTTLKLVSPSTGFLLGSSTAFRGLDPVSNFGLSTTAYRNGSYSLSVAAWNLGLTTCLVKEDGSPLDIPQGTIAILPDVPQIKVVGPVIKIPVKSLTLKEDAQGLSLFMAPNCELFRIAIKGHFAFITNSDSVPKPDDWTYLVQASSALKRIIDSGINKSQNQREQLILNYLPDIRRAISGFGNLCDSAKVAQLRRIQVYRLDITAFGKRVSQFLYQRIDSPKAAADLFEQAFSRSFPEISALAVFIRKLDFTKDSEFGMNVYVDYQEQTMHFHMNLSKSSMILPERAASALSLNTVFQA